MRTRAAFIAGAGSAAIVAIGWSMGAQALAAQTAAATPTKTSGSASTSSASPTPSASATKSTSTASGINGTFTGSDVYEQQFGGDVQVAVTFKNGVITNVATTACNATHGREQACPMLTQEAIQAKSANISVIGGATFTSQVYIQSMQEALDKAGYKG